MNYDLQIEKITSKENIPFELLLLADETLEAIGKYINASDVYVAKQTGSTNPIAVFVLQLLNPAEIEIKNIAVATGFQRNGIGSCLIERIQQIAKQLGCVTIWVGTPDCATREISFYERNGFKKAGFKKNFFIDNYIEPIFDNGVLLKDMVMLSMEV
ncbi:GNAT family N-acetyltransferase [Mucilaginibacter ginsenosidivorans]|uniref:GNAT family N-acetyltransferase n=1 Tax=Mucilaginibacter ginsenosidivorans TaxID=398053 RepID=A0A5B8UYW2_9SPHI|nr:GNAT family N-acetyltransferase [Mucilaginibacter ginsenosidivorans]QEC64330.1 GNAT family N-acetyltransferase [Mucilaginibacter ginsenosidivorans]